MHNTEEKEEERYKRGLAYKNGGKKQSYPLQSKIIDNRHHTKTWIHTRRSKHQPNFIDE